MATLLTPQNQYSTEKKDIKPKNETDFSLDELYEHLKCSIIEVLYFKDNSIMIIDEEGKLKDNSLINTDATYILRKNKKTNDFIVGNAIICEKSQLK